MFQNDGSAESLMRLTDMKQIFHKQLPKMPKTYISRLVFDTEHKTLGKRKDLVFIPFYFNSHFSQVCTLDGRSIGGICFRPFPPEFVEITFLAVTTDRQVRGYGSLIMTHLKVVFFFCSLQNFYSLSNFSFSKGFLST